jgi:hypothetical protein
MGPGKPLDERISPDDLHRLRTGIGHAIGIEESEE